MEKIKLLLVEDDSSFAFILKGSLELTDNYEVQTASNGKEGLEAYWAFTPDVIVADIEMPEMSGIEMVEQIRKQDQHIPMLFASAKNSAQDLINGYKLGVDNYIRKPFLPEELNAHIQALLKRVHTNQAEPEDKGEVPLGKYLLNVKYNCLTFKNEQLFNLSPREAQILNMLCEHKGELVMRKDILSKYWGNTDFYTSRSLDVFIYMLRKYLEQDPTILIQTVRGEGFRLVIQNPTQENNS